MENPTDNTNKEDSSRKESKGEFMTAINAYTNNSQWFCAATTSVTSPKTNVTTSQAKNVGTSSPYGGDTVEISSAAKSYYQKSRDTTSSHLYYRDSFNAYDNSTAKNERIEKLMNDYHNGTGSFVFDKYGLTQEGMTEFIKPENYIGELKSGEIIQGDRNNPPGRSENMKAWYEGTGTFQWNFVGVRNEDGYIAIANTDKTEGAKAIWDNTNWNNSEEKLNAHLSAAELTPGDFSYIDGTRLFALEQEERSDFLNIVDGLLSKAGIDVRASQLEYGFNDEGYYDVGSIGLEASDMQVKIQDVINEAISRSRKTGDTKLYNYASKVKTRGIC